MRASAFIVARRVSGGTSWIEAPTESLRSRAGLRSVKVVRRAGVRRGAESKIETPKSKMAEARR